MRTQCDGLGSHSWGVVGLEEINKKKKLIMGGREVTSLSTPVPLSVDVRQCNMETFAGGRHGKNVELPWFSLSPRRQFETDFGNISGDEISSFLCLFFSADL